MFPSINKKQPSTYDNKSSDFEELKKSTLWKFMNSNPATTNGKIKYNDFEFVKRITIQDFN